MSNRSVVIFTFRGQDWSLATTLEIISEEIGMGSRVRWAFWLDKLAFPRELPISEKLSTYYLKKNMRSRKLVELFKKTSSNGEIEILETLNVTRPNQEWEIDKVNEACYLEMISRLRESAPSISSNKRLANRFKRSYVETYNMAASAFEVQRPDIVYLYNGRFLQERAVADCCASLGIRVIFFERFNPEWKSRFFLFERPTHSPSYRSQIMQNYGFHLKKSSPEDFDAMGEKWFRDRQLGITQSFTKNQNQKPVLEDLGKFVVFFHSSEDELITTDLTSIYWGTQIEAIEKLINVMRKTPGLRLVIRIHPNLKYKSKKEIAQWAQFEDRLHREHDWITFLNHENKMNSYDLILGARSVITVGSTIGVEAAFMGKRSILIGRAFHEEMGITSNPKNVEELSSLLTSDLNANDKSEIRDKALNYANFHISGGQQFKELKYSGSPFEEYFWEDFRVSRPYLIRAIFRIESKLRSTFLAISNRIRRANV
jgi:hypothetical protein